MIIRNDITAETYCPLPITYADYRRLRKAFREDAPDVDLDHGYTETGAPFLVVGEPGAGLDDDWPCITRNERAGRCTGVAMSPCMSLLPSGRSRSSSGPGV